MPCKPLNTQGKILRSAPELGLQQQHHLIAFFLSKKISGFPVTKASLQNSLDGHQRTDNIIAQLLDF